MLRHWLKQPILMYVKGGQDMKNKIAAIRKTKNISQQDFAKDIDVSVFWLNKIENGKHSPGFTLANRIAEKLGVTLNDIFL